MTNNDVTDIVLAVDHHQNPEIFYSLQGEGPFIGRPSIFLRLSMCNLFCHWCDTAYTWNWIGSSFKHMNHVKYSIKEEQYYASITEILHKIRQFPCHNIVLTGGEPLLQQKQLIPLLQQLKKQNYTIDIETNGTITPLSTVHQLISSYVVSPKLSNSKVPLNMRLKEMVLRWFNQSKKNIF